MWSVGQIDEFMHRVGYLAGRLDVMGGSSESLVELCREVKDELSNAAEVYWRDRGESS